MENLEMIDGLRKRTNCTYAEAKNALERTNYDMVEAIILIERESKKESRNTYSYENRNSSYENTGDYKSFDIDGREVMDKAKKCTGKIIKKGKRNRIAISKDGKTILNVSLLTLGIVTVLTSGIAAVVLGGSIFFGYRVSVSGEDFERNERRTY